jgi:hypothetical protein
VRRSRSSQRGVAYVEVLVIVGVVLTLGLLAVGTLARASTTQAEKEAECIRSFACAPGAPSGGGATSIGVPSRSNGTATPSLGDYVGDVIRGAVLGDYAEGGSAGARLLGQVLVGFTPLGVAADIRDLSAALHDLRAGKPGAGLGVALATAGFLPGGDLLKLAKRSEHGIAGAAAKTGKEALGDLRPQEISQIQRAANELGSDIYVTGSAARGARRGVGSDLPLAGFGESKKGTKSDIDYAVKRGADDTADKLDLPDKDKSFGVRGVDFINLDKGPVIRFSPGKPPEVINGSGKLPL